MPGKAGTMDSDIDKVLEELDPVDLEDFQVLVLANLPCIASIYNLLFL